MKIKKLTIENFKKFKERFEFDLLNQNFLVGENNTGKTSLIESIQYLLDGPEKDKRYKNLSAKENEHLSVEAVIVGDFSGVEEKYRGYVFEQDGIECIKIKRSDEEKSVDQPGKKGVQLNESKIQCWNEVRQQFENPAGKDTTFNIIEVVPVYAHDHVEDIVSFDSTKILGKLIKKSLGDFFETDNYQKFQDHHNQIFNAGPNSLRTNLESLAGDISKVLNEQWGEVGLSFKFDKADHASYLKKGSVLVNEGGTEHELVEKGSGFQRSVMLSMVQVLSNVYNSGEGGDIVLCIDEPELNLHPLAQEKLATALGKLSKNIQVIISTHSPYMLKSFKKDSSTTHVFGNRQFAAPEKLERLSVLPFGPTLAEIQYFAYRLVPIDLHNELYGYLESEKKLGGFKPVFKWLDRRDLERYSIDKGVAVKDVDTITKESLKKNVSLQMYIRHSIHHPENKENKNFTHEEIRQSVEEMIQAI